MICDLKNSPSKFQPSIRSKSAGIKTRVEKEYTQCKLKPLYFLALALIRADLYRRLKFLWWVLKTTNHRLFPKGLKSVDFRPS